jgi:c-di-GMP-binding flagellar brake protein YcgR
LAGIADILDQEHNILKFIRGDTEIPGRWRKAEGSVIIVDRQPFFADGKLITCIAHARQGLGLVSFTARIRLDTSEDRHDLAELVVESYKRVQNRAFARALLKESLEALCSRLDDGLRIKGYLTNISGSGAGMLVRKKLEPGTRCMIKFALPLDGRKNEMELPAEVIRQDAAGEEQDVWHTAWRFIRLDDQDLEELKTFNANQRRLVNFVDTYNIRLARRNLE